MGGMQPLEPEVEAWDKKKIMIAVIILLAIIGIGYKAKVLVLGKNQSNSAQTFSKSSAVAGANTEDQSDSSNDTQIPSFSFSPQTMQTTIQSSAQEKLNDIKKQVADINIQDIASSSPQVQKVINDLKSLENYPRDQAKQMCENICKNL